MSNPLIKLDPQGTPAVLSYDLPEPTSYRGRHVIELDIPEQYFKPETLGSPESQPKTPPAQPRREGSPPPMVSIDGPEDTSGPGMAADGPVYNPPPLRDADPELETIKTALKAARDTGYFDPKIFPNIAGGNDPFSREGMRQVLTKLSDETIVTQLNAGNRLTIYRTSTGDFDYRFISNPKRRVPRILLIEQYRLSTFLGRYGVGRTLKTFSLLPGERTKIAITSYRRSEETLKQAASILDSTTDEIEREFERTVLQEQTKQENIDKSLEYHAEAEAEGKASWGWGSASIHASGGVKGSTNAVREEFGKNMANAVAHNAAKASTRRDVQIDTTYERTTETRQETAIERELTNINVSRTLNFVFKQMNQEYVTLLHLVDVRVAYFDGFQESRHEVALPELGNLLAQHVRPEHHADVTMAIRGELATIVDYNGVNCADFIQDIQRDHRIAFRYGPGGSDNAAMNWIEYYACVNPSFNTNYKVTNDYSLTVPGVIIAADRHVMRTDGVVVDAFLGQGDCLDAYSHGLQDQAVRERQLDNDRLESEIKTLRQESAARQNQMKHGQTPNDPDTARGKLTELIAELAIEIVKTKDAERAEIFNRVFPGAPWMSNPSHNGAGGTAPQAGPPAHTRDVEDEFSRAGLVLQP